MCILHVESKGFGGRLGTWGRREGTIKEDPIISGLGNKIKESTGADMGNTE